MSSEESTTTIKKEKKPLAPTTIVIFGVTGNLAKIKLIPALWQLFIRGNLPDKFHFLGFSFGEMSNEEFRTYVRGIIDQKCPDPTFEELKTIFLEKVTYISGDFTKIESYQKLATTIEEIDASMGMCSSKLFHLAVQPTLYETIFELLHVSGLSDMCGGVGGWTRILVEKPFGSDWNTANLLDHKLSSLFRDEQIFRVDHYLGKESMQNILAFRFSNSLLEHLWSKEHIEAVHIRLFEKIGLEGRGAFYDKVGAFRDVGQNHLLQMLALTAMEEPGFFEANLIREARAKVLSSLRMIAPDEMSKRVKHGQYEGFKSEPAVDPQSHTETYFRIEAHIDNDRWAGVPFFLESGKNLGESLAEIEIVFRGKNVCMFLCPPEEAAIPQNTMVLRFQPKEEISISFWAKKLGFDMDLEKKVLSFTYDEAKEVKVVPDAYEHVIYDCILGDQKLFASTEEVLASWNFVTPIIKQWDELPLFEYPKGWVPERK